MKSEKGQGGQAIFTQEDRPALLGDHQAITLRKTARIIAIKLDAPFMVHTDRGPMTGMPGDWLVTNHPDDDAGSDLWTISDERMKSTYETVNGKHDGQHRFKTVCLDCGENGQLFVAILGPDEKANIEKV
jgi:hypothetical protein